MIEFGADGRDENCVTMPLKTSIVAALALALVLAGAGYAQAPAPRAQVVMPDAEKIVLLLRTTLVTLNDAVQTGNFTVLRDMGAPGFSEANSAARLSQSFSDLASKRIDLSPVTVIAPQLTEPPSLDQQKGMLHLKGYFPGNPVQINFEVLYQSVGGRWRLFGLSVQPDTPAPAPAAEAADDAKSSSSSAEKKK